MVFATFDTFRSYSAIVAGGGRSCTLRVWSCSCQPIQPDSVCLLHLMKSWSNVVICRAYYWTWLRLAYVTVIGSSPDSCCTSSHIAHYSISAWLKPAQVTVLLVLTLALLALQNSLIYHGEWFWEKQLRQNRAQQITTHACGGRGGIARGRNRNKRLTGSRGHVLKLRLGEWWEEQKTGAAFSLSLSVSVWSSEGTLPVQCSEACSRVHSNIDE